MYQHVATTHCSNKSLHAYWIIFMKIFFSATEFCRRKKLHKFSLIMIFCNLFWRQRFLQKFSRINEAICRCYVSLACVASVSVWKDRGTRLSVLGAREMERQPIFAQKRWLGRLGGDATCCCNYSPRDLAPVKKRYKSKLCPKT